MRQVPVGRTEPGSSIGPDDVSRRTVFHRMPVRPEPPVEVPRPPTVPDEPSRAVSPAWNTMLTGIVAGTAVAAMTGQWFFAVFSVVTGVVTGLSWLLRMALHSRKRRVWRRHVTTAEQDFANECHRCARELARIRRMNHPTIAQIRDEIFTGGTWFWGKRILDPVCIGFGPRAITVAEGAPVVACDDIPILVDIPPGAIVGVYGRAARRAVAAMIVRMAARVGPSDWKLAVFDGSRWPGIERLPHWIGGETVAASSTSLPRESHRLLDGIRADQRVVAVVGDPSQLVRHSPIRHALERNAVTVIAMADELSGLPSECEALIDADDLETDGISSETLHELCTAVSRWSDPDCLGGGLPERVELRHLIASERICEHDVRDAWRMRRGCGPRAIVGFGVSGVIDVDFDRDGPHAVVIGTTGSGKSELLRHLVVSIAMNGSPEDVSFVLIDYKGGSAFDICSDLPHVVGVVTDLDVGMARRVLLGLRAELHRRESILRSVQVSDIREFHRRQRESTTAHPDVVLPRMIVVIDELAALREEVPDFVPALAAIAQRGRSLGIHLVAASQRANALSADVLANASLRMALRVQSAGDSQEVIGTDRAAFIARDRPGRMIIAVGGASAVEVQAAHVSTVLPQVAETIATVCANESIAPPHRPWCDPLPESLVRPCHVPVEVVGIADDVHRQVQTPWPMSWSRHLLIAGGVGRTNALRTILSSLEPERVDVVVVTSRKEHDDGLARFGTRIDMADHETMARAMRLIESRGRNVHARGPESKPIALVVDDLDVWRAHASTDRMGSTLWENFERILATISTDTMTCIATAAREQSIPATIHARLARVWRGSDRPGVFRTDGSSAVDGMEVQFFWEPPKAGDSRYSNAALATSLRRVPTVLERPSTSRACAVVADTWSDVSWTEFAGAHDGRAHSAWRFLVIGPVGSGVTSTLRSLADAWSADHPSGRIFDLAEWHHHVKHSEVVSSEVVPIDLEPGERDTECADVLLVIDDPQRVSRRDRSTDTSLERILTDGAQAPHISVLVGATPSFLRSQPDHWIHLIRRHRTGVLLARSAADDGDLLGVHVPPLHPYSTSPGRGLWVDGAAPVGIVQFFAPVAAGITTPDP